MRINPIFFLKNHKFNTTPSVQLTGKSQTTRHQTSYVAPHPVHSSLVFSPVTNITTTNPLLLQRMNNNITLAQDRQARGKPPPPPPPTTHPSTTSHGKGKGKASMHTSSSSSAAPPPRKTADEQFEERERRDQAARILGSRELLIWHAVANDEVRRYLFVPFG